MFSIQVGEYLEHLLFYQSVADPLLQTKLLGWNYPVSAGQILRSLLAHKVQGESHTEACYGKSYISDIPSTIPFQIFYFLVESSFLDQNHSDNSVVGWSDSFPRYSSM